MSDYTIGSARDVSGGMAGRQSSKGENDEGFGFNIIRRLSELRV